MCSPQPYGKFFEYFTALLANLLTIGYGFMFGLTPPTLLQYKSQDTPLSNGPLSDESISWITTILFAGAVVGAVLFKHLAEFFGPRSTLLIAGILQNLGWFAVAFGYNYTHICISRCVVGISGGAAIAIIPTFLIEISTTKSPENPHTFTFAAQGLGVMAGLLFGTFADFTLAAIAGLVISVLFSLCFPFVQESPFYYLKENNVTMLEKSLRYFRAIRDLDQRSLPEFEAELDKFKQQKKIAGGKAEKELTQTGYTSMGCCDLLQLFVACMILVTTSQLCGLLTILNYSSIIFTTIDSELPANISATLMGASMLFGSILAIFIAKCSWRKFIIFSFTLLTALSLACLGYYLQKDWQKDDEGSYMKWIPLTCMVLAVLLPSASIYPMTFIIIVDVFPQKSMNILKTFYHALHWILGALLIKFHFHIVQCIGLHYYFWIFASVCLFQCVVLVFILPKKAAKNL